MIIEILLITGEGYQKKVQLDKEVKEIKEYGTNKNGDYYVTLMGDSGKKVEYKNTPHIIYYEVGEKSKDLLDINNEAEIKVVKVNFGRNNYKEFRVGESLDGRIIKRIIKTRGTKSDTPCISLRDGNDENIAKIKGAMVTLVY